MVVRCLGLCIPSCSHLAGNYKLFLPTVHTESPGLTLISPDLPESAAHTWQWPVGAGGDDWWDLRVMIGGIME